MKGITSLACLLHLFLFLASIFLQACSGGETISVTEPLQDPNFIVSSGNIFKLGFFSPENASSRYVGLMYNVPKMEVVWVANRDKPLHDSSGVLTISEDGNLVILNGKKEIVWSSNASSPVPNSTAQLLENGNLVLRDSSNGASVWESFQIPTDTLMRTMRVGRSEIATLLLTSWRSPSDPSPGNFTLGVNPLQIPEIFVWNRGAIYWRSGPWNGNVFVGIPGRSAVYRDRFDLVTDNSGTAYFTYNYTNVSSLFHYRLNSSGSLQEVVFDETGDWKVRYSTLSTECGVYGKCGPNGRCDPNGSRVCSCLPGFKPGNESEWTEGKWSGGCLRKTVLQCDRNSSTGQPGEGDGYLKFTNVKVPDLSNYVAAREGECANECLKNCSCSAYTFVVGLGCLHWAGNLIDIQQFSMDGSDLYIRVAHSELDQVKRSKQQKTKAIIASTLTAGCIIIAASLYILWRWRMKHRGEVGKSEFSSLERSELDDLLVYSYETLASATDSFHNKNMLGQGGFGPVYKGKLLNGQEIAVKRLSHSSGQGIKEFMNEVTVISKLQHRNLVRLLGCCVDGAEKMLVYEYMPNKSLDAYIFDARRQELLDWNRRSIIIEGISRGLLYLHRDSRLRIIHRDMKASNILLDEDLDPKISDFGLARIFGGRQDQGNTNRVVGTYGYMAPEYAMGGKFSEKSDVYSYGVLLLEIVSGKRNTSFYLAEENLSLLGYAWKQWNENEALSLAFIEPMDTRTEMEIMRCIHIGLLCVQESADDRPNMSNVLLMLNSEIVELPRPKTPAYTARLSLFQDPSSQKSEHSVNDLSLTEVQGR